MSAKILPLSQRKQLYENVDGVPYLKRNRDSGIYYVRKFKARRGELFASTGTDKKGLAKTRAEEMIASWLTGGRITRDQRTVTIRDLCDDLRSSLRADYEAGVRRFKTWDHDQTYLKLIEKYFGTYHPGDIDEIWWDDWLNSTGRKLNRKLFDLAKYLSKILTFAHQRKYISRKPKIKNPDRPSRAGRVLSDAEISRIAQHADEDLFLQMTLAYECGMRTGEIRGLRWDMIRFEKGSVRISLPDWFVKANARSIEVSPRAALLLKNRHRKSPFVFPAQRNPERFENEMVQSRRWRKALALAKIDQKTRFYDLRHSFYTKTLLELGLPIQLVSEYGGTSIQTLQRHYLHGTPERTRVVSQALMIPIRERLVKGNLKDASNDENE